MRTGSRNIFLFMFLFVYLFSVAGLSINKHFCGGELEEVSILEPESCCEGETADEPDDCCSNESLFVSNKTETLGSEKVSFNFNPELLQSILTVFKISFSEAGFNSAAENLIPDKPPYLEEELISKVMVLRI